MDLLFDATLLKATQLKKNLKKSKMETQKLHASSLGDGVGSQPKVPDEQENKTTSTNERTGIKPGVLDVPKYLSESENESWGDSGDDDDNKDENERKRYIDLVEKSVKDIIKDEVKSQLPQILPKEVSDYATPVIQCSILLNKIQKSKSYGGAQEQKDLYDALVKSYKLGKDLFESYGKVYSLKREREDKDKDEDPLAGSDQGLKKQKTSKDAEPSREEPVFETSNTEIPLNQGEDLGNTDDQSNIETWINKIAKAGKPPTTFDELMSTPINFSAYVLNNLKIENLTQKYLVGPAFNLLKGTCKSRVELEYHFKECYKAVTDKLDWTNLEGHKYPFDLSMPLPLIEDQGLQAVPANYFFNNYLEYLKGGSLNSKYMTSKAKTKATKCVVILKRVEDLQLGVESYQKKLNITRHETFRVFHDIASNLEMDYSPKRRWHKLDRKRSRIMIKVIDQQLFKRRLMRNLEKFVEGREYEEDFRLLEQTI
nr:hypothetical protein [Tanacetum cinerariifolium]